MQATGVAAHGIVAQPALMNPVAPLPPPVLDQRLPPLLVPVQHQQFCPNPQAYSTPQALSRMEPEQSLSVERDWDWDKVWGSV